MAGIYRLKPWKDRRLNRIAFWLADRHISPNLITLAGLLGGLAGAFFLWRNLSGMGLAFLFISILADLLDGAVARAGGSESLFGKLLDAVCDRIVELSWVGVLVISGRIPWWGWFLPLGSVMLLWARAYAFRRGMDTTFVACARFERMAAVIAISALPWHGLSYPLYFFATCATFVSVALIVIALSRRPKNYPNWTSI